MTHGTSYNAYHLRQFHWLTNCIARHEENVLVKQSIYDAVTGELSLEYFAKRFAEGWKLAGIEWVRESSEASIPAKAGKLLDEQTKLPYGFQITDDGTVQEYALEAAVLLLILDQIVQEKSIPDIAIHLNGKGYSTREGKPWGAASVFNLLPRLIEAAPSLLKSAAWQQRRSSPVGSTGSVH
jgi:hypothetical protein